MLTRPKFISFHHRERQGQDRRSVCYDLYKCQCGNNFIGQRNRVTAEQKKSCGCWLKENARQLFTTHGRTNTPTYKSWLHMNVRCNNPKHDKYKWYGGKGIKRLYKS